MIPKVKHGNVEGTNILMGTVKVSVHNSVLRYMGGEIHKTLPGRTLEIRALPCLQHELINSARPSNTNCCEFIV